MPKAKFYHSAYIVYGGSDRNVASPELLGVLKKACADGAEIASVAFPPLEKSAFYNLAFSRETALLFFFENAKKNIAEAALALSDTAPAATISATLGETEALLPKNRFAVSLNPDSDNVPAPKIFICGTFEGRATATLPQFQISRTETGTQVSAHFLLKGSTCALEEKLAKLFETYEKLKALAGTSPELDALPPICGETEVGGDWYLPASEKSVRQIRNGELGKIVLARAKDFRFATKTQFPHKTLLANLRERFLDSGCTLFSVLTGNGNDGERIVGASPEMLVRAQNGLLETEAIAGTIANDGTEAAAQKLFSDIKERREHQFVIDYIVEKLSAAGAKPRHPDAPEILRLPNVFHLRTPIRAELPNGQTLAKIAETLHPTPAMCGVPAEKARARILATEPFPRENFSAPLGFIDGDGNGFFAVAIRCAKIFDDKIRLYAGSGLVAESAPAKEFAEIDSKFSALKNSVL